MKEYILGVHFIIISADKAGQRIDNFLRTSLKDVPKSMIYRIVRKGEVRVNKKKIKPKYKLKKDDEIRIPPIQHNEKKCNSVSIKTETASLLNKSILYEDNDLLILNKPSGIAVHSGSGVSFGLIEWLRILRPESSFLELVHRLDRETSGVLLIAKKRSALRFLHEQFRIKEIQKDYLALVHGQWNDKIKIINAPLLKRIQLSREHIMLVNQEGKPSETRFSVQERFRTTSLVKISPITGRTHQIRVHAQHAGYPIVHDYCYGIISLDKKLIASGLNRLFLHAISLSFKHPNSGKTMYIEAPLDNILRKCLIYLRKDYINE